MVAAAVRVAMIVVCRWGGGEVGRWRIGMVDTISIRAGEDDCTLAGCRLFTVRIADGI
jgi:hypothetical protein